MMNILIVDDNHYFLAGLSMSIYVHLKDCNILTAGNGRNALEIMESLTVDCVVIDLEMPDRDGQELAATIRKGHPALPVVILMDSDAPEVIGRLARLGAFQYMPKLVDFRKMAHSIASAVGARCEDAPESNSEAG
jgi:DNA-binding NarL/FixJ family response regulator